MVIYPRANPGLFFLFFIIILFFYSCANSKRAVYFNNVPDTVFDIANPALEQTIIPNDILSITISSLNPEATVVFNNTTSANPSQSVGYLVDHDGYIQFPLLGKIKAAGSTKKDLTEYLRTTLIEKKLLVDPVVAIRYLNFRVTVLGEVSRPMVVTVPDEKISLLEALGMAGDLTIYARRDNVLLIRDENGKRIIKRINLNSGEILNSPYYYLKSNDIVYAEPNNVKIATASNTRQIIPIVLSGLSFVAIIVSRAIK